MRILRLVAATGMLACATVASSATPASAHGVGGVEPRNLETRVLSIRPDVPGIELRVVDLGDRLELRNDTDRNVVVYGYDEEPYLRIGPRGTFENVRSPATYLNRSRYSPQAPPKSADPNALPKWRRVSSSNTASWHDHRAHWMGRDDPPVAQRHPDSEHEIRKFSIQLSIGDRIIEAHGDVRWIPGPSPWPWVLGALALIAAMMFFTPLNSRLVVSIALGIIVVSETAHIAGSWGSTTASGFTQLAASAYSLGGVALALLALIWVIRRGFAEAAPLVLLAALFVAIAGGLADVTTLGHSQLPTNAPDWIARVEVTLALGLGTGLAIVAALALRPGAARRSAARQSTGSAT